MTYDPLSHDRRLDEPRDHDGEVFHPNAPSRGLYLMAGVIGAIVIGLGVMFFADSTSDRSDLAHSPDTVVVDPRTNETRTPPIPARPQE